MPHFARYIAVDYSGAAAADHRLPGLRVYGAEDRQPPAEVRPADGRHWSRRRLAAHLLTLLTDPRRTCLGIDHGFGFPQAYLDAYRLPADQPAQPADFAVHRPTDGPNVTVRDVRNGSRGNAAARRGDARRRRRCEQRCRARSIFHFDVPGSVAGSTHAGLPRLHQLRQQLGSRLHCRPFDGLLPPADCSPAAEIYPRLWPMPCRVTTATPISVMPTSAA
jgi:hypothetical protein